MKTKATIITVIATVLLVGSALAYSYEPLGKVDIDSISIAGKIKKVDFTDDNTDEDLIIRSDQKDYGNWAGGITVYFSVTNNSSKDQDVDLVFSFNDEIGDKKYIDELYEHNGSDYITHPAHDIVIPAKITPTTTEEERIEHIGETVEEITKWKIVENKDFTDKEKTRKDTKKTVSLMENTVYIEAGETKFFKAKIKYTGFSNKEEFFIEAFGDKDSYGHLDPWVFEELFDDLDDGLLDTQNSWDEGGSTKHHFNVQQDDVSQGTKAVENIQNASGSTIGRTVSDVSDGIVYIDMMCNGAKLLQFELWDVGTAHLEVRLDMNQGKLLAYDGGFQDVATGLSAGVWYRVGVEFDATGNHFRVNIDGGSFSDWYTMSAGTLVNVDFISLYVPDAAVADGAYFDYISPDYSEAPSDTCTCPTDGTDWYVNSSDDCYLATSCDLDDKGLFLLNTGSGSFHIIDNAILSLAKIESTSTPVEVDGGSTINFK